MWRLGFFFHEMGFGLLSIFLPLHVIAVGGSLVDIGIMASSALFLAIPFSFFWGYMCDKQRRYRRYILLSFLSSAAILYLFTLTSSTGTLIVLYALMSLFHVAHEPPKNVLIAELYSREKWERTFAFYEGFTETGWLIGLVLGFFLSTYSFSSAFTLTVCSALNFVAFILSLFVVADPLMIFERRLVNIEKAVGFAHRGISLASAMLDGLSLDARLEKENANAFCVGLVLFSLATSTLFTPMPVFISEITTAAELPASVVFVIFVLNSVGGIAGYLLAGARSGQTTGRGVLGRVVLLRSLLASLLIVITQVTAYDVVLATGVLVTMGFAYALFLVQTLSLSMELIPAGKSGLFNVLVGVGGACGSFLGPLIAHVFGFACVFGVSAVVFLFAYVAFRIFR